jgi:hypothetical protein
LISKENGTMQTIDRRIYQGLALLAVSFALTPRCAWGHADGILVQTIDGQLVTGINDDESGTQQIGVRAFTSQFPSTFAWSNPGFHSLSNAPAGTSPLPESTNLDWDFLPMTEGGLNSNLLYWDGSGSTPDDVEFGPAPGPNYTITLFGRNNEAAAADGTSIMIPGKTIDRTLTGSGLRLHAHRYFFLDDGDGSTSTDPADGIYLIAMQLRMEGFRVSDPFYLAWGTLGASPDALESAALRWIEENVDSLIMPADVDNDGDVDFDDIDEFVLGLTDPSLYASAFGVPATLKGDIDNDGDVDFDDIGPFVQLLNGAAELSAQRVPEAGCRGLLLLGAGILILSRTVGFRP